MQLFVCYVSLFVITICSKLWCPQSKSFTFYGAYIASYDIKQVIISFSAVLMKTRIYSRQTKCEFNMKKETFKLWLCYSYTVAYISCSEELLLCKSSDKNVQNSHLPVKYMCPLSFALGPCFCFDDSSQRLKKHTGWSSQPIF